MLRQMSATTKNQPYKILSKTTSDFDDQIKQHAKSCDKVSLVAPTQIGVENLDHVKSFYESLPYSLQRCVGLTIENGSEHPANFSFDKDLYNVPDPTSVDFHLPLTDEEVQATGELLDHLFLYSPSTADFIKTNESNEFVIETDEIYVSIGTSPHVHIEGLALKSEIMHHLDGLTLKYIRPSSHSETAYAIYMEKNPEFDPIKNRIEEIVKDALLECPNCNTKEPAQFHSLASCLALTGRGFACRSCGIAIDLPYIQKSRKNLSPSAPRREIRNKIQNWVDTTFNEQDILNIHKELTYVGEDDKITVYENLDRLQKDENHTEFWIEHPNAPSLFYTIEDGYRDKSSRINISCQFCGYDESFINSVKGAYHAEGSGMKVLYSMICDSCIEETADRVKTILRNSENRSKYLSKII